jgi:hypothetical protein
MDNDKFYKYVSDQLSKKGKFKLANCLAHKYELKSIETLVRIERGDDVIFISVDGDTWLGHKCL